MGKVLSKQAIEEFHKKGYHLPIQAVSREAAVEMRGQLEAVSYTHLTLPTKA